MEDLSLIEQHRQARYERLLASSVKGTREQRNLTAYSDSIKNRATLKAFASYLPSGEETEPGATMMQTNLKAQVQIISAAFSAGVSSAADLQLGGFDTHSDHDASHAPLLRYLNESIDLIWQLAEQGGYADRLTVVIGSDFSRTPNYNSGQGKDHWPIGSVIVMQDNPTWGSRTTGITDAGHNALPISFDTLEPDEVDGSTLYPKHVHQALRRLTGIEGSALDAQFPFLNITTPNLFG